MPEKKKKQPAEFAKDKNVFAGGAPTKGDNAKNAKQKQPDAHQPRDADKTSGHDVNPSAQQKDLKSKQSRQAETFGHNVNQSAKQIGLKSNDKPEYKVIIKNVH